MMSNTTWNLDPSLESTALVQIKPQYELFIDGKWQAPLSKTYFDSINPADETHLAKIAWANQADVDLAVRAARTAYTNVWSQLSGAERGKYLFRIARLMQEKARELAVLETLDGGKPIREARDVDVPLACNHFLRGLGRQTSRSFSWSKSCCARCGWSNHSLEFSAAHARLENCSSACLRQYSGTQAS
jgi:delta 1-pyrroline-5-carboxylate dehydrogenase